MNKFIKQHFKCFACLEFIFELLNKLFNSSHCNLESPSVYILVFAVPSSLPSGLLMEESFAPLWLMKQCLQRKKVQNRQTKNFLLKKVLVVARQAKSWQPVGLSYP